MRLVICNNTKENFLWEPKKINVKFHKNCENTGKIQTVLGTCQKLGGGGGVKTEGGSQLFETAQKGGVMKNGLLKGGGSCKCVSVIM